MLASPANTDRAHWISAVALTIAAIALAQAVQVRDGLYQPRAFVWLTIAALAALVVVARIGRPALFTTAQSRRGLVGLLIAGALLGAILRADLLFRSVDQVPWRIVFYWLGVAAATFVLIALAPPGKRLLALLACGIGVSMVELAIDRIASQHFDQAPHDRTPFYVGLLACAILAAQVLLDRRGWGKALFPILLAGHFLLGMWLIRESPRPHIDVWQVQTEACEAMIQGRNPYAITFKDIYGLPHLYPPGWTKDGRVLCGFPYMPVAMYLNLPGYLLGGDYRYSLLGAVTLAAALMAYARPGILGAAAAILFLFNPRIFFVLEMGWTDPYLVLLLAATVFCACRLPRLVPVALGAFCASKQYLIYAIPAAPLLLARPWRWQAIARLLVIAGAVGCALTLPLVLLDHRAFIRSAMELASLTPFRTDALSYLALLAVNTGVRAPEWIGFAAAGLVTLLGLWRVPAGGGGYAAVVGAAYLFFFAFNKFAFCNYYFFVFGALCAALAAITAQEPPASHNAGSSSR
jgi:hypothetical protein